MMKRLLCSALAVLMIGTLCACRDTKPSDDTDPTTTVPRATTTLASTTTSTEATDTTTTQTEPPATETVYQSETLPFTVTLPASWDGAYAVREENNSVQFYELNNHLYDGSGHLFTIRFVSAAIYDDGMFPSYELLGTFGEKCVVALFPTDVQTSSEYADQYHKMEADIDGILATFTYTG